jgi:hypothetical protein
MYGDWSRIRFNSANQYTAVVKQQGRVDIDSDDLEQHAIDLTLRQHLTTDVIGEYGGPADDEGFAISVERSIGGYQILIGPGRYYVQGIMVENLQSVSYDDQPYLIDPADTGNDLLAQLEQAGEGATLGFVLQAWQRLVTALDDPCLLEPALGQADTTVRLQTVWRVIGTLNPSAPPPPSGGAAATPISQLTPCCQALYNQQAGYLHTGEMRASLAPAGSDCGCQPIAAAGYQGLENQLYRVEIHHGGDLNSATFKWSRENGSVVTALTSVNGAIVTVSSLGPDTNLGFQAGQWVELTDDTYLFGLIPNQSGTLYQIQSVNPATLQVTMTDAVTASIDPTRNARVRRWDQSGPSATSSGIAVSTTPIALENGILVNFGAGEFQPGDYWTIPARTANGQIDWPPCGGKNEHFQPANYMPVSQAPVACVGLRSFVAVPRLREGGGHGPVELNPYVTSDCRLPFPPLTSVNPRSTSRPSVGQMTT